MEPSRHDKAMSNVRVGPPVGPPTGTCFINKIYAPSSSLLQGKHLPFTPSPSSLAKGYDSGPPSLHPWRI